MTSDKKRSKKKSQLQDDNPWDQYSDYLRIDKILDAQDRRSALVGNPAHDEMLFIIFHQTYELWFKQILFELDDIQRRFAAEHIDESEMQPILARLDRIVHILRLLVQQIDVLETMAPQDFIDFREYLETASGFQSLQFRLIEARLGLRREDRIPVFHGEFDRDLCPMSKESIKETESGPSLFNQLERWLERTPFTERENYKFWESYREAVHTLLDEKEDEARASLSGEALKNELNALKRGRKKFEAIFDPENHKKAKEDGLWRLSLKALQAGLFITLYRREPILQVPSTLLSLIMDVDELLARWRYRHALMVQRMMGASMGTGGSSGYGYLMETLEKHRIFTDLFSLSTFIIPSGSFPPLPEEIREEMGYHYRAAAKD